MLTGELAWDKPTSDQAEYNNWKDGKYNVDPWKKIDNLPLSLLRKVLMPVPSRRYKLDQIQNHIWVKKKFKDSEVGLVRANSSGGLASAGKRLCLATGQQPDRMPISQPVAVLDGEEAGEAGDGEDQEQGDVFHGFTQPAQLDNMLVSTQGVTQTSQTPLQRLVKRRSFASAKTDQTARLPHLGEGAPIGPTGCPHYLLVPDIYDNSSCVLPSRLDIASHYLTFGGPGGSKAPWTKLASRMQVFISYLFDIDFFANRSATHMASKGAPTDPTAPSGDQPS